MLVAELKEVIKEYPEGDLRLLIVELYKAMPKKLREDKDIDVLIRDMHSKKPDKKQAVSTDVKLLKPEIEFFLENAYAQNYMAPNRIIPKQERSKWRFKVKAYIKALQAVPSEGEEGLIAADLLEKLYKMMCYGCCYYIFNSDDTFRSVGIMQTELLDLVLKKSFANGINKETIKRSVALILEPGLDRETIHSELLCVLAANLKTTDAKETAIREAMEQKSALDQAANISPKNKWRMSHTEYERNEKANILTELVFRLNILLCEYEEGIRYFKKNICETDKEIELYVLLQLLYQYDLKDWLIKEYEEAVKKKVEPRESLVKVYQYTKVHGGLPDTFW